VSVRPADSTSAALRPAAESASPPSQAQDTGAARPAAAARDSFGFHIPSPGDIWHGVTNVFDKVKNTVSDVIGGAGDLAGKAADALNHLVTEDIPGFAGRIKDAAVNVLQNAGGQAAITFLNKVGAAREKLGIDPPPRGLKPDEITELKKVFGDTVDYSQIRVHDNVKDGLLGSSRAMTLGNDIYMPTDRTTDSSYGHTLVHEMTHAWQGQNGGPDYAAKALEAQLYGDGDGGWGQRGYDWETGIAKGKSWKDQSPEQQAELIENAYQNGMFDNPSQRFVWNGTDYTDYLNSAVSQLRNRQGAP
jgi:hypothetical protein